MLSRPAAPTPGLSHIRMYSHTYPCTLIHARGYQSDDEGSNGIFPPQTHRSEAARRGCGESGSQTLAGKEILYAPLCSWTLSGISTGGFALELLSHALLLLFLLGLSPPTASDFPGQS